MFNDLPPPCCPDGKVSNSCARRLYAEKVEARIDLPAPWHGWRIRGGWLIGPGGMKYSPRQLSGLWEWIKSGLAGGR